MAVPARIFGYRPDPPHKRDQKVFARHFEGAAIAFPNVGMIKQFAAPTFDQGGSGSCGGHGTTQGVWTSLAAIGAPLPWIPSPDLVYKTTRCIERADVMPPGAPFPKLQDSGIMPADLMRAISRWGIAPMYGTSDQGVRVRVTPANYPALTISPDGRFSDVWTADDLLGFAGTPNVNLEPDFDRIEEEKETLLVGEDRIDEKDPQAASLMAACIGVKRATVGLGVFVDSAFFGWKAGMLPLDTVNLQDPRGGGHWVCCDHYYVGDGGRLVFEIHNSWSRSWGDLGRVRVTENWIRQACSDIYPLTVQVLP